MDIKIPMIDEAVRACLIGAGTRDYKPKPIRIYSGDCTDVPRNYTATGVDMGVNIKPDKEAERE